MRSDVDQVRFSVGLRGYRMDEVDDVLDRLAYDLEARDARISVLEQEVATRWAAGPKPAEDEVAEDELAGARGRGGRGRGGRGRGGRGRGRRGRGGRGRGGRGRRAEDAADEDDEDDEDDEETLVGRTMIVPFQQTDSRFVRPAGEPSTDHSDDPGPERGD